MESAGKTERFGSHGIVEQHGGHVGVDTQPGEGTTFTIYLVALAISSVETSSPDNLAMPHGRGELVLVVEEWRNHRALWKGITGAIDPAPN